MIFNHYMRDELNYKTDMFYYTSGGVLLVGLRAGATRSARPPACCATRW